MDNRRLILMLVFCFSLVMLWDAWQEFKKPKLPPALATATQTDGSTPRPTVNLQAATTALPAGSVPASRKAETVSIKTDLFAVDVSTLGGDIVRLDLNSYKAIDEKEKRLALFEPKHQYLAQSGLIGDALPNHKTIFSVVPGNRQLGADAKTLQLRLEAETADGIKVAKIFTFTRGSYLIDVAYEIHNGSQKELVPYAYFQFQRDDKAPDGESQMVATFTGPSVYTEQEKYQKVDFAEIEKGKAKFATKADNGWLAMVQHYFVAAWLPAVKTPREYYMRKVEGSTPPTYNAGVIVPVAAAAPGAKTTLSMPLYAGPQTQSILDQLAKPVADGGIDANGLPLVVDYGWLTIVAAPIFWCLDAINKLVGNWGWSIVLLTICIKGIFYPLSAASYKSMAKMRTVTPRLVALKERHGSDRAKLNQEMMELYKREKINPLGGCLPILVQIPVFIALYWALLGAVEMRDAPWVLWITDLSSADPFYVLPVIMVVTMLIQTKLNPTPPDPIQAKVMMAMPFIFGGMFFFFPAGLVLYWVVNNTLSIAQQWQITRMVERGGKAANDAKA
jgi:YidC/Oxa1 family membrane protein insertase